LEQEQAKELTIDDNCGADDDDNRVLYSGGSGLYSQSRGRPFYLKWLGLSQSYHVNAAIGYSHFHINHKFVIPQFHAPLDTPRNIKLL
jgi:hypothetical protein